MDLNYETKLSPKNREKKLKAIRDVQALLSEATDILIHNGIAPCAVILGGWEI